MNLTNEQVGILRHSLGIGDDGRGCEYRNYFVAGANDEPTCRALVSAGCMEENPRASAFSCGVVFHVTDAGRQAAGGQT